VLAFHPLSVGNPDRAAQSSLDVAIADAAKITDLLARARRLGTDLPAGPKPVWVTELNWESSPASAHGVPPARQAVWISRALHRLWVAGVSMAAWQFLVDPYPGVSAREPDGDTVQYPRPAGLYSAGADGNPETAQPKPFLEGFSFPFDPLRVDASTIRVWALLGHARERGLLQRRDRHGGWVTIAHLRAGGDAVLNAVVALRGAVTLRLADAGGRSAPVSLGRLRSAL